MYAGAASGAVTIGLALFLVLMSQKPNASETQSQPPPEAPTVEQTAAEQPPLQAAVVLPPPPAPASTPAAEIANAYPEAPPEAAPPEPSPIQRPALKPRKVSPSVEKVEITPLKPRTEPAPPKTVPPREAEPVPTAEEASPEQVANRPATEATSSAPAQSTSVPVTKKTVKEGRALLKMLEIGKGPVIEIAWPQNRSERSRLYDLLTACHGMQTAMLAGASNIYAIDGAPGATWNVNRDAVSGFIRQPAGELTDAEKSAIERIKARHGILYATPVRLFPRGVDAVMLGGLGQIVGPGYLKYNTIRARYRLSGNRITVADVRVDGKNVAGGVALPRTRRCG